MKIQQLETFSDEFVCFVKLSTDSGQVGWGQTSTYNADISATIFHRQIAPWALGWDALDIGERARFALPDIFWTRLQREYAKAAFVESRGEAASIVTTCEFILSCLRNEAVNEDVCTDVPPASSSFF